VSSFASWLDKASKASSKLSVGTNASATIILAWRVAVVQHCSVAENRSGEAGALYFSLGGIDIHEVLHVEMLVEQSSSTKCFCFRKVPSLSHFKVI